MKEFLAAHPQVRTALRVFTYSFLSVFGLTLSEWLLDIMEWAQQENLPFPDVSVLGKAAASALAGAFASTLAVIWNALGITKSSVYVTDN